ncbi:hypothetical protein SAMN04515617_104242 [Collimonas sp. OK242]|nr:hypothetical protein SAMN04515617_104242 [Collimonas sp. OK242]
MCFLQDDFLLKSLHRADEMFSGCQAPPQTPFCHLAQMRLKVCFIHSIKVVTSGLSCGFCW